MDKIEYPLFVINAFTNGAFSGNPAAVCLVKRDQEPKDELKQKIATEMKLSETAFVTTYNDDDFSTGSRFGLRWFTPTTEVQLCGHATLASSAVLFNSMGNKNEAINFDTLSGMLTVRKNSDGKFEMDFPNNNPEPLDEDDVKDIVRISTGTLPYQDVVFSPTAQMLLIRLDDSVTGSQFQSYIPPFDLLHQASNRRKVMGVILTLKGTSTNECVSDDGTRCDFVSRYFGPWTGVDEDPVTGSAHTVSGPYWANILGKKKLFACQCSKRVGQLCLDVSTEGRVKITGSTFMSIKGSILI